MAKRLSLSKETTEYIKETRYKEYTRKYKSAVKRINKTSKVDVDDMLTRKEFEQTNMSAAQVVYEQTHDWDKHTTAHLNWKMRQEGLLKQGDKNIRGYSDITDEQWKAIRQSYEEHLDRSQHNSAQASNIFFGSE